MAQLFQNNFSDVLSAPLTASGTTLSLTRTDLLEVTGSNFILLTLETSDGLIQEIVKVTAHAADSVVCTVERAQEGTEAREWGIGDKVEARLTAGSLKTLGDRIPIYENTEIYVSQTNGDDETGDLDHPFATVQAAVDYVYGYLDIKKTGLYVYINVGPGIYGELFIFGNLSCRLVIRNVITPNDKTQTRINTIYVSDIYLRLENLTLTNELGDIRNTLVSASVNSFLAFVNIGLCVAQNTSFFVYLVAGAALINESSSIDLLIVNNASVAYSVFGVYRRSYIHMVNTVINVLNSINLTNPYGSFFFSENLSIIFLQNVTKTGNKCNKYGFGSNWGGNIARVGGAVSTDWGPSGAWASNDSTVAAWSG